MTARAIVVGPGAARALRAGGSGRLEVALGAGGYVRLGVVGWILVAPPRAPIGPLSLLVGGLTEGEIEPGCAARTEPGALLVGGHRIELAGVRPAVAKPPVAPPTPRAAPASPAFASALAALPQPPPILADGLAALRRGDVAEAVAALAGRGDGLTPAGDDVLAAYAGWRHAVGAPHRIATLAAGRSSPIGLAYLRCAERGELPHLAAALTAALLAGDAATASRRARALRAWGSSSGAALLWGMATAAGIDARAGPELSRVSAPPGSPRPPRPDC